MAEITKMFVHFTGTKEAFINAGHETTYTNSIAFIAGGGSEKACIYTHGSYFGDVQSALNALNEFQTQVYNKRSYIKGVKVGETTFVAPDNGQGAIIPFASLDPSTVTVDAASGTITIGLKDEFVSKVNTTATNLGTASDASTASTAFGRIARLDAVLDNLMNGDEGIETIIKDYINTNLTLDSALDSSFNGFGVSINQENGKIKNLTVTAPDVSTIVDGKIDASIKALDSSAEDSSNGFKVYVELEDGKLKKNGGVIVTAPDIDGKIDASIKALDSEKDDTDNGVYVKVTQVDGKIDSVDVSASVLVNNYKKDISDAIKALDSSDYGTDNGIYVKVIQVDGSISDVIVDASGMTKKADLDELGKILAEQLPDYILGQVLFGGTIDGSGKVTASTNFKAKYGDTTVVPTAAQVEGAYFVATGNGTTNGVAYNTGDWVISTGESWVKVDNTDAVSSVAGLTGAITASALAAKLSEDGIDNELALKSELDEVNAKIADLSANLDASSHGVRVAFKQVDGLVKDLVVEAPDVSTIVDNKINELDSSKTGGTDVKVTVTQVDGMIDSVTVDSSNIAKKDDITTAIEALDSSAKDTSNGFSVYVELKDGKLLGDGVGVKVTAPDVSTIADGKIALLDASKEDSDNGVKVAVTQTDGKITSVDVTTTIADTSVVNSTGLVNNAGLQYMFEWVEL